MIREVGTLSKGAPCAVMFSDGRKAWLCRVTASMPLDEANPHLHSIYECTTPHGSVVVAGAVWVRPLEDEELQVLATVESAAKEKGVLYGGKLPE